MLSLLPDGAQVVIELDLERLRKNAVVGEVASRWLDQLGADARVPGIPIVVAGSPLGKAQEVVLASYGVGTAQAATIALLETKDDLGRGVRVQPDVVVLAPDDWTSQVQARAQIGTRISASEELLRLRHHAEPTGATGAVLRVTARLPFDARIALARQTGLPTAPAQMSVWGDVADDLAVVIDADATDPGDRQAAKRMATALRTVLEAAADAPAIRAIGIPNSLLGARLIAQGSWVRAIIDVGPRHLQRAIERARAMLGPS